MQCLNPKYFWNETYELKPLFWHYPNWWGPSGPGIGSYSAVRKGNWKLIYFHHNQTIELYNLKEDIGQQNNLAESNPEKLSEMITAFKNIRGKTPKNIKKLVLKW